MASVAKWLRQWIVIPPLGGSSPLVRPHNLVSRSHWSLTVGSPSGDGWAFVVRIHVCEHSP